MADGRILGCRPIRGASDSGQNVASSPPSPLLLARVSACRVATWCNITFFRNPMRFFCVIRLNNFPDQVYA